jgi:hypothetical protein
MFGSEDPPEAVSGLYGPGAYASWLLVILSSLVSSFISPPHTPDQHRVRVDADILSANIYAIVSSADFIRRAYLFSFHLRGASFMAAGRVVWIALIFSLAIIGPNRGKTSSTRLRVQYIGLWIFTISQLLTRVPSFPDFGNIYRSNMWNDLPRQLLGVLRNAATTTIPLAIYYRWSAAIPSHFVRLLAAVAFFLCFTYGEILVRYYWLFLPISADDVATWRFRILVLPARSELKELDQVAPLITSALILLWQWKIWKLGSIVARSTKNSRLRSRSNVEEPPIDLEAIPPTATDAEAQYI